MNKTAKPKPEKSPIEKEITRRSARIVTLKREIESIREDMGKRIAGVQKSVEREQAIIGALQRGRGE